MRLYDAHNHLQDERLAENRAAIVAAAAGAGIARMVVNGSCEEDWPLVRELSEKFPQVLPSFGYHPWYVHERTPEWRQRLVYFLDSASSAVGEIGLDRWKPDLSYERQEDMFVLQLLLAADRNLPVSIHCLRTWGRMHELLRDTPRPARGFLLHSYGGPREMVEPLAKLGAYFSFPGNFIDERKTQRREAFAVVPLERLLIETDAPDQLLPESHNRFPLNDVAGKAINHPANLAVIYEFVASERGLPVEGFAARIEENFFRLFGI